MISNSTKVYMIYSLLIYCSRKYFLTLLLARNGFKWCDLLIKTKKKTKKKKQKNKKLKKKKKKEEKSCMCFSFLCIFGYWTNTDHRKGDMLMYYMTCPASHICLAGLSHWSHFLLLLCLMIHLNFLYKWKICSWFKWS